MKIAIATSSFARADSYPMQLLQQAGVKIKDNPYGRRLSEDEIIEHLQGVCGLIAGLEPLNRRVLSAAKDLKAVARVGIGMDNVDQQAAAELGIRVSNTPDGPTEAVAEMCLCALLALGRRIVEFNAQMHNGKWNKKVGLGLRGTRVLLIGYGRIGSSFARILRFFGAEILATDPYLQDQRLENGQRVVSLEEGLAEADVVSLHASGKDVILDDEKFKIMRPGVILMNSARGELVDENALIQALEEGIVSGAWFDSFWQEPYTGLLGKYEQVLLTPHVSTYTKQCRRNMEETAVRNLLRDLGLKA